MASERGGVSPLVLGRKPGRRSNKKTGMKPHAAKRDAFLSWVA